MISDERIMGFVDGEGCFSIAISKYLDRKPRKSERKRIWKNPSIGFRVKPSFRITIVKEDDAILYDIKDRLGAGKIYQLPRHGANTRPASQYYAETMVELAKIVEFFIDKKFYIKGKSFELWVQCLKMVQNKEHLTKEGLLRICELRDQMNPRLGGKNSRTFGLVKNLLENKPEHIEVHANQSNLIHNMLPSDLASWYQKRKGKRKISQVTPSTPSSVRV